MKQLLIGVFATTILLLISICVNTFIGNIVVSIACVIVFLLTSILLGALISDLMNL